jgi:uroporphyrinogen decarboxylase
MSDGFFRYPAAGPLEKPADLERLQALPARCPWILRQVELVRRVVELQPDTPYFYNIFSPATSLRFLVGRAALTDWLKSAPEAVAEALARMGRGLAALAEAVLTAGGADGIYLSVQNPDLRRVTDGDYARLLKPADLAPLAAANAAGGRNILHICGYEGARNNLAVWADYPAQAFSWAVNVEGVSLGRGKELFGGRAVIGGFANGPGALIAAGSRPEIEAFTKSLLAEAGRTGVIIGADCTLPADIRLERLEWVRLQAAAGSVAF